MTINQRIIQAVTQVVEICVPDLYEPGENEPVAEVYCTFNYSSRGGLFSDDIPSFDIYMVQVHLFAPFGWNSLDTRKRIKARLFEAGFTWPTEVDAGNEYKTDDAQTQHVVFECEIEEGVDPDG